MIRHKMCYVSYAQVCANLALLIPYEIDTATIITTEIPHTARQRQRQLKAAPSQDTDTPPGKNGTNSL
jgi:hypothetical protein